MIRVDSGPQLGVILTFMGHLAMFEHHFGVTTVGGEMLLASNGQSPGMLLNIFQYTGQHPQQRIL